MNFDAMRTELSDSLQAELRNLAELPDDHIDTSDIPEVTAEQWATGRRGAYFRPLKTPVTIRLDTDVIGWFKQNAPDGKYQSEINRVLRQHVLGQTKSSACPCDPQVTRSAPPPA
jgi:uncharacterized protein (DUF4415 family)